MKKLIILCITICALLLPGCLGKTGRALGPVFDPDLDLQGKDQVLYLYRPFLYYRTRAKAPYVLIDGKKIVVLKNGGFTKVWLKPGKHLLELQHSPFYSKAESKYSFTVPPQVRRIFLRVTSPDNYFRDLYQFPANAAYSLTLLESPAGKLKEAASYPWQKHDFYASFVQESAALEEIAGCRYLESEDGDARK